MDSAWKSQCEGECRNCLVEADMCGGLFHYFCNSYSGAIVHNTVNVMEVIPESILFLQFF